METWATKLIGLDKLGSNFSNTEKVFHLISSWNFQLQVFVLNWNLKPIRRNLLHSWNHCMKFHFVGSRKTSQNQLQSAMKSGDVLEDWKSSIVFIVCLHESKLSRKSKCKQESQWKEILFDIFLVSHNPKLDTQSK